MTDTNKQITHKGLLKIANLGLVNDISRIKQGELYTEAGISLPYDALRGNVIIVYPGNDDEHVNILMVEYVDEMLEDSFDVLVYQILNDFLLRKDEYLSIFKESDEEEDDVDKSFFENLPINEAIDILVDSLYMFVPEIYENFCK